MYVVAQGRCHLPWAKQQFKHTAHGHKHVVNFDNVYMMLIKLMFPSCFGNNLSHNVLVVVWLKIWWLFSDMHWLKDWLKVWLKGVGSRIGSNFGSSFGSSFGSRYGPRGLKYVFGGLCRVCWARRPQYVVCCILCIIHMYNVLHIICSRECTIYSIRYTWYLRPLAPERLTY